MKEIFAILSDPVVLIIVLFLGGVILFALISTWTFLWEIRRKPLEEARKIASQTRRNVTLLIGLLLCDFVLWLLRSPIERGYSLQALLVGVILANLVFGNFVLTGFLAVRQARRRIRQLEQ